MIKTKEDLRFYIAEDKKRYGDVTSLRKRLGQSEQYLIWKVIKSMRVLEYYENNQDNLFMKIIYGILNIRHHRLMNKYGLYIHPNCFGPGLYIPHLGTIHTGAIQAGRNCTLRPGLLIMSNFGVNNKAQRRVIVGDNVEFSEGCKIMCKKIGNNVIVGPNAVVVRNIPDNHTAFGVPAKNISRDV